MLREQFFEVHGKSLNCAVGPANGPPLILFHGVTRRWQSFVPLLPDLMTRFEIYAFDYLGHGKSDRSHRGYRVADYVETMATVLSAPPFSHQKHLHFYGHSLGSMVAAALASQLGARVKAVVLEDPPFDTMGQGISKTPLLSYFTGLRQFAGTSAPLGQVVRDLCELRMTDPATGKEMRLGTARDAASLRFTAKCLSQLDPHVFDTILNGQWLDGYDSESILAAVKCPTLLLQADTAAGGMLTDENAVRATTLIEDCTHLRVVGAPHLIHWQKTEVLLRHVQSFLESVS